MKQKSIQDRLIDEIVLEDIQELFNNDGSLELSEKMRYDIAMKKRAVLQSILSQDSIEEMRKRGLI